MNTVTVLSKDNKLGYRFDLIIEYLAKLFINLKQLHLILN